ncbi:maltoporin [Caldimonas brevitalea]|uniref:Maltoporin n=1 Tax=Caldimonas brevitalea TaxID=413882 RepID=A0A0G3BQP1_9BURK|nr:carbohydrate porin [Caldimonas brevitalea]AKJ29706.1 maltoporin [Caldimonas brevitalea]
MRGTFKLLAVAAAAASAVGAAQAQGIEFTGYFRTGVGSSDEGSKQVCFSAPSAGAKYRLGNECETYGELALALPFGKKDGGAWAKYNTMIATIEKNAANTFESVNGGKYDIASRQNYFEGGGFFGEGALRNAKVWVGKRYYNRHDVHINDYYYWTNSGLGGGIEDIAIGASTKLAFAYHQKGDDTAANDTLNALNTRRISARIYDVPVNPNGTFETELVVLDGESAGEPYKTNPDATQTLVGTGEGVALFLQHKQTGILGGYNKFAFIYGQDAGAGGDPTGRDAADVKGKEFRLIEQLFIAPEGSNWSGQGVVGYQRFKPDGGDKLTWFTIGVRPQYNFSDNFSLAVELGHDRTKVDGGGTANLTKFTIAPQLALARGFWSRPVFRAFVTYAKWNDELVAAHVRADSDGKLPFEGVYGDKGGSGVTYGLQVEAWW